ncbi:MAG: signal peptidase I [Candidatus Hydrogenedentales bacterium]
MAESGGSRQGAEEARGVFSRLRDAITFITGPWTVENGKAWLKVIVVVLLIRWLWFEPFSIPSGSMEPTLHGDAKFLKGDRVAVNKLAYGPRVPFCNIRLLDMGDPARWDIVVFITPEEGAAHKVLIKRVAGLPGERVTISRRATPRKRPAGAVSCRPAGGDAVYERTGGTGAGRAPLYVPRTHALWRIAGG